MKTLILLAALLATPLAYAEGQLMVLVQGNFADQPLTDRRMEVLGGTANAWDDPAAESIGIRALHDFSARWSAGLQADYGRSSFRHGSQRLAEPPDRRTYFFDQQSDLFDVMVVGRRSLCDCARFAPFVLAGAGMAYASGSTLVEAQGPGLPVQYNYLRYETGGWFPTATAAVGVSAPLGTTARWSLEFGAGYQWGSRTEEVELEGPLRFPGEPAPRIDAETSVTGAALWVGLGRRF